MPYKSQFGFAPVLIVILLAIIAGSSALVVRNIPFNQPIPTLVVQNQSTDSAQVKISPSPTLFKASTVISSQKPTPTPIPVQTPTSTTSNNNSNNSGSSSNNTNTSSPTNTPAPASSTAAPTATATPTTVPTATPAPVSQFVKVTYPNGRESLPVGSNITVTWDTNMPMGDCAIQTIDSNNSGSNVTGGVNVTNKSIGWAVDMGNTSLTEKQYKIYMVCHDFNGGTQFARSDSYFTVHK